MLLAVLSSVLCLTYFYLLDRVLFSSRGFAPIFAMLITTYDVSTAWLAVGVCVVAALWRRPDPILWVVDRIGAHPHRLTALVVIATAAGALFVYHNYPLCMDEYAAAFQSKVFASGSLYAQLPAPVVDWLVTPGFNGLFLVASRVSGHAIEGYWPGFAALLAPFQWLRMPWLCNAALTGLSLHLIFRITLEATNERRAAAWAALFAISSSAFLAYGIAYYSMQAHLAANLLFAWLLWKPTVARSVAAGLVGSLAICLHNPFPHALFAAPWILALLLDRQSRRFLIPLGLAYLPGLAVMAGWMSLRAQIMPVAPGSVGSPFGWPGELMLNTRVAGIVKLWVWATPGLFIIAYLGWRHFHAHRQIRLLAASAALTFIGYLFVTLDQGHGWGYRYFQSAWGVIAILAAVP